MNESSTSTPIRQKGRGANPASSADLLPRAQTASANRDVPSVELHRDTLDGYSAEQTRLVFEVLAGRVRTMQQLLMLVQNSDDSFEGAVCLDAAVIITTEIGAMADAMVEGSIIGDRDFWTFGPNFAAAGTAVQA